MGSLCYSPIGGAIYEVSGPGVIFDNITRRLYGESTRGGILKLLYVVTDCRDQGLAKITLPFTVRSTSIPIITSNGGEDTATITVEENDGTSPNIEGIALVEVNLLLHADQHSVSYKITGGADRNEFTIFNNNIGGYLRFETAPDFENPTDIGGDNTYEVEVSAVDRFIPDTVDTQVLTIIVTNVNEAPTEIILSLTGIDRNAGDNTVVGKLSTIDPDIGNEFVFTLVPGTGDDDNGAFSISRDSLRLNSLVNFDVESYCSVRINVNDGVNDFPEALTFVATSNSLLSTLSLSNATLSPAFNSATTIYSVNVASTVTSLTVISITADTNASIALSGTATDGSTPLTVSGGTVYDLTKGANILTITVTAENGTETTYTITVNVNNPPTGEVTITGTPKQKKTLMADVSTIADMDGLNTFSYQWKANDTDISGAMSSTYVLTQAQVGQTITVTVSYTDDVGMAESLTSAATIAVANINNTPIAVGTIPTQTLTLDNDSQTIDVSDNFSDADGETLNYTTMSEDESIVTVSIDASDILTLTPIALGSVQITITARDLDGATDTQIFIVIVEKPLSTDDFNTKAINVFSTSNGTLRITGLDNEKAGVQLFNILGSLLLKTTVSSDSEVKFPEGIKTGVYIIKINTLKGSFTKKIIK